MSKKKGGVKPGRLRQLAPFDEMPAEYGIIAAPHAKLVKLEGGQQLMRRGQLDTNDYYLLKGEVTIEDTYCNRKVLMGGTAESLQPLPQLRPCAYDVVAIEACLVLLISQDVVKRVREEAPERDVAIEDDVSLDITQTREFFADFKEELHANRVRLPSLRDEAGYLHNRVAKGVSDEELIDRIIAMDPAIAAKIMKAANSSLYGAGEPVKSLRQAVERIDADTVRELVACFSVRDVYSAMPDPVRKRMTAALYAAQHVSVLAQLVAEMSEGLDPEQARLAGLMHNIGVLPIFSYAMANPAYSIKPELIDRALGRLTIDVGTMIAEKWHFDPAVKAVVDNYENWSYAGGDAPDIVDCVVAARYLHTLSAEGPRGLPRPGDIPALAKFGAAGLDFDVSRAVMDRAKELLRSDEGSAVKV